MDLSLHNRKGYTMKPLMKFTLFIFGLATGWGTTIGILMLFEYWPTGEVGLLLSFGSGLVIGMSGAAWAAYKWLY